MRRPWYASNARELLESRQQGMKPEGWVTVALGGGKFASPMLSVRSDMPAERLDWQMLAGLKVQVEATPRVPVERIEAIVHGIAGAKPAELRLHFSTPDGDTHQIDVGSGVHLPPVADVPAVHNFFWAPLSLRGTNGERALVRSLLRHQPKGLL